MSKSKDIIENMILKELYLYPDLVEFSDEIVHPFRGQSRSICNYLARKISSIKYKTDSFNRICFICCSVPKTEGYVNSSKVLSIEIPFDPTQYKTLSSEELNPYFAELLEIGINKCNMEYDIPSGEMLAGIAEFRDGCYVNEWIYKTKTFKSVGVKCSLECKLTLEKFHLNMVITKGRNLLLRQEILKTPPDELCFSSKLKDVILVDGSLVVIDRFGEIISSVDVEEITNEAWKS